MDDERDYIQILLNHRNAETKFIYRDYFDDYAPDEMFTICLADLVDLFLSIGYDKNLLILVLKGFVQGMKDENDEDDESYISMN